MKYIFFLGWIFTFGANAQNVVSVHLNDVLCHLKSHELAKHISDSLENRIHIYDDSIRNHFPNHCTIGWDEKRCEKWGMDYERLVKEQDELVTVYFTVYDSLNNEIKRELKSVSVSYCILNKIDLFFTDDEPPLFGVVPKDVSEEFATYILSLK